MAAHAQSEAGGNGYPEELARAETDIVQLQSRRRSRPNDLECRVRLAYRLFHRATLTGIETEFRSTEEELDAALRDFGPKEDLCLLKANLDFRFHRNADTRRDLQMCPLLATRLEGRALLADLDFQEGRYESARQEFEQLVEENRSWDNLARLAHWHSKLGDQAEADRFYAEAEDDLTAKQMRAYAWLELQVGLLALNHGRYADARKYYERAAKAYPGHWHTDEYFAELLAAEGRLEEAAAMFHDIIVRTAKPEFMQALGEVYALLGQLDHSSLWLDRALAGYLQSVNNGGVHYYHHLADFYTDARSDPAEAVRWARLDLEMRPNFATQSALARALHLNGHISEATRYMRAALDSGVQDARIFAAASALFKDTGDDVQRQYYSEAALRLNPRHHDVHMHH